MLLHQHGGRVDPHGRCYSTRMADEVHPHGRCYSTRMPGAFAPVRPDPATSCSSIAHAHDSRARARARRMSYYAPMRGIHLGLFVLSLAACGGQASTTDAKGSCDL